MPAIAIMTVRPETSTARPDVAAATSIASSVSAPFVALLALAAQVEQRVVDADGHADEQDHRGDRLVDRHDLARQRDEADRGGDGRQREEHRQAGGDERAEGERAG